MLSNATDKKPLVSIIIPCYNHGRYLVDAINSIRVQHYPATEIIVVDDGSTDNTQQIVKGIPGIISIYQDNRGLSAARNTGIKHSTGEMFIFLDADDWLLPGSIETNIGYLLQNNKLAFVSGAHEKVFEDRGVIKEEMQEANAPHYLQMLQGNYIGMHATVLYRRWVFDELKFDESLRACEDYDLYLNITRKYPVLHHAKKIAAYRIHNSNMSANIPMMLATTLKVLDRQQVNLHTDNERLAYRKGHQVWKDYYSGELYKFKATSTTVAVSGAATLFKYKPVLALKYIIKNKTVVRSFIKKNIPAFGKRWLHRLGLHNSYKPDVGKINAGDLDRLKPFSLNFGYDRGGPVDRYYIENFLQKESASIKGRALEIGDNEYTLQFGGSKLTQSDILHIDASNTKATFIGDLSDAPHLPDNTFDCIVLTQTLHLIYNFTGALNTCHRILKPGGVLLLTSPGITPIDRDEWKSIWYWSFTDTALSRLIKESFPGGEQEVATYGNVYTASAFLYGMGKTELSKEKLDYMDPHFQVIITVKATKKQ